MPEAPSAVSGSLSQAGPRPVGRRTQHLRQRHYYVERGRDSVHHALQSSEHPKVHEQLGGRYHLHQGRILKQKLPRGCVQFKCAKVDRFSRYHRMQMILFPQRHEMDK